MKKISIYSILTITLLMLYACPPDDDISNTTICEEDTIQLTEREVIAPVTNTSYFEGFTYYSIQANTSRIKVVAIVNATQTSAIIETVGFSLVQGTQQLNNNPYGKVQFGGYTYTTYYQPNGQSYYTIQPKGEILIHTINQDCNTISGTISIQAYTYHDDGSGAGLGEIRFSTKFDFENVPLDNQEYQIKTN